MTRRKSPKREKQARPEPAKIIAKAEELAPVNYVPPAEDAEAPEPEHTPEEPKEEPAMTEPTTYDIEKKLPLKRSLVISEQDLQALAEKILAELDIDPGEVTEKKIEATAKVIGADIFSKIFHDNPAILEQHVLNAPKYIERYEEVRTYKSNWERLLKALHDKKPSYINHSKDWDRISRILRRCYRPEAVKKKAQEIDVKKAEALEWDVLTELQRARFRMVVVERSLKEVLRHGLNARQTKALVTKEWERAKRERRFEMQRARNEASQGVIGSLTLRAKRGKTIIRDIEDLTPEQIYQLSEELETLSDGLESTLGQIEQVKAFLGTNGNGDRKQEPEPKKQPKSETEQELDEIFQVGTPADPRNLEQLRRAGLTEEEIKIILDRRKETTKTESAQAKVAEG